MRSSTTPMAATASYRSASRTAKLPRLLRAQVYVDLVGLPPEQAKAHLLQGVRRGRRKPPTEPPFPQEQADRAELPFPGHGLEVTNLPPRNPDFAGRSALLEELHETLPAAGKQR